MTSLNSDSEIEQLLSESAWMRGLALALTRSAEDADDLVQETWLAATRRPPAAKLEMRPWLSGVMRNVFRNGRRKGANAGARDREVARPECDVLQPSAIVERLDMQDRLSTLVRELPEKERDVVLLRFHEGLTSVAIAGRLGMAAGTVRWRLKRGLDALRAKLDREHDGDRATWMAAVAPLTRGAIGGGSGASDSAARASASAARAQGALQPMVIGAALLFAAVIAGAAMLWMQQAPDVAPVRASEIGSLTSARIDVAATVGDARETPGSSREDVPSRRAPETGSPTTGGVLTAPGTSPAVAGSETVLQLRAVDVTGAPVSGAEVSATPSIDAELAAHEFLSSLSPREALAAVAGLRATTDGDGRATLRSSALAIDTELEVSVCGPHLGRWTGTVPISPGEQKTLDDVTLAPSCVLVGGLLDADQKAVPGTVLVTPVHATNASAGVSPGTTPTDWLAKLEASEGKYSVVLFEEGSVRVWAKAFESAEWCRSEVIDLSFGDTVAVDLQVLHKARSQATTLRIINADGDPVTAFVDLGTGDAKQSRMAFRGKLTLEDKWLLAGTLSLRVFDHELRYVPVERELTLPAGDVTIRLEAAPQRELRIKALSEAGDALPVFTVTLTGKEGQRKFECEADDEGAALQIPTLAGLPLEVSAVGFVPEWVAPIDVDGADGLLTVTLSPLRPIYGTVTHEGRPVVGATVRIWSALQPRAWWSAGGGERRVTPTFDDTVVTNAGGEFELPYGSSGDVALSILAPGLAERFIEMPGFDPAGERAPVDVAMMRPGRIVGRVGAADAESPARRWVVATHPLHKTLRAEAAADGSFTIEGVPPGEWHVRAQSAAAAAEQRRLVMHDAGWQRQINCHVVESQVTQLEL